MTQAAKLDMTQPKRDFFAKKCELVPLMASMLP
jgi:hypothetical protein